MKIYELLGFNKEILQRLDRAGIKPRDYKYIDLYEDYQVLLSRGDKITYIVVVLSEKYDISERQVYNIVGRFSRDVDYCKIRAVE